MGGAHTELVEIAARWLRREHYIVVSEMASGAGEEPDGLGFNSRFSTLVECKASRSDWNADRRKPYRMSDSLALGTYRWLMCPSELVQPDELTEYGRADYSKWGLLWVKSGRIYTKKKAEKCEKSWRCEQSLLVSCIRRIGQDAPEGVSVRCYNFETKNNAALGIAAKPEVGEG
jgi:hypothetical protein